MSDPNYSEKQVGPDVVGGLLDHAFQVPVGSSFFEDFPSWRRAVGVSWQAFVDSRGQPVACAGMMPGDWLMDPQLPPIPVIRIGGVATHENMRGRGLASALVRSLLKKAASAGVKLAVLWGQETPLYTDLGFRSYGRQIRAPLGQLVSVLDRTPGLLRLESGTSPGILPEMERARHKYGGVILSARDREWIFSHRHTQWARVLDGTGAIVGHGAFGRGIDLTFQLHEWGGTVEAMKLLGRWALSLDPRAEIMGTQPMLEEVFGELPGESIVEPLALVRVLDSSLESTLSLRAERAWFWGLDGA